MDYKNAGVDIEAGYKSVELMKQHIAKTMRPEVLGGIGGKPPENAKCACLQDADKRKGIESGIQMI